VTADVTIVIPHYRAPVLADCLASIYAHTVPEPPVIVVDDGQMAPSLQAALARFPQVQVLHNPRNLGFSASCNRGLEAARSAYAVLLNDDTRVTAGWLAPLVAAADADPRVAACQPKLLSATEPGTFDYGGAAGGYIDRFGFTFCRGRLFAHRERDAGQYDRPRAIFWACGSAMLVRLAAVRQVGCLDAAFFMHFEEIDLCWRLQLAGYTILAVPQSVVYHHSGYSLPSRSWRKAYLNHRNNLVLLLKNLDWLPLCRLLPARLGLEMAAGVAYLLKGEWSAALAPAASLGWLLAHPRSLRRRRARSRAARVPAGCASARWGGPGVYSGSALWAYYARGRRRASDLLPEPEEPPR